MSREMLKPQTEITIIVTSIAVAFVLFFLITLATGNVCLCYLSLIVGGLLVGVSVFYAIRLRSVRSGKKEGPKKCLTCGRKLEPYEEKYCPSWKTRTRRCMDGPYCSRECLKEHHKKTRHEHNLLGD